MTDFSEYYKACAIARETALNAIKDFIGKQTDKVYYPKMHDVFISPNELNGDETFVEICLTTDDRVLFTTEFKIECYTSDDISTSVLVALCEEIGL